MPLRSYLSAALLVLAGTFVFQACSKQGEGERCESANGNDDCESPLLCKAIGNGEICCPDDKAAATTAECRGGSPATTDSGTATDTGAPTDTGAKTDTGAATDTGTATDTGAAADTGAAVDTGASD